MILAALSAALSMKAACLAPLPYRGQTFAGAARIVHDGDTLCIGPGADHAGWVKVRLADFYAPELGEPGGREATEALRSITAGAWVVCVADHRSYDRAVARCTINGKPIGELMKARGVQQGGRGWK